MSILLRCGESDVWIFPLLSGTCNEISLTGTSRGFLQNWNEESRTSDLLGRGFFLNLENKRNNSKKVRSNRGHFFSFSPGAYCFCTLKLKKDFQQQKLLTQDSENHESNNKEKNNDCIVLK
jgi:hypothetical protein